MQVNPLVPKSHTFKKTISNVPVQGTWGSLYISSPITVSTDISGIGKRIEVNFVLSGSDTATCFINTISSNSVTVFLARGNGSSGVTGTIYITIYED